jgi:metal-responsive CopG/Arc/MetJ family transcriptional regulator
MRKSNVKRLDIIINLPDNLIDKIDVLVSRTATSRADVIETLLNYCVRDRKIIDKVFHLGEESEWQKAEEEKEIEESEKEGEEEIEFEKREEEEEEMEEGEATEEKVAEREDERGL